jgi:hypothetical protein
MAREIGEFFLTEFIRKIIESRIPFVPKEEIAQIPMELMQSSLLIKQPIEQKEKPIPRFIPSPSIQIHQKPKINYSSQSNLSATDKLNMLIRDPYVNEIECVGADNFLLVKKSGITQTTQISLGIDEVYELIAEFSQKTRIPVIGGRIKAALNDLIITAVLSESLGPRFIIQKRRSDLII